MTIIVATRDFIAADSRLSKIGGGSPMTVGKIFKRRGGGLFATAGHCRRTYHFEKAMRLGRDPESLEVVDDEEFEAVLLTPKRELIFYDTDFCPCPIAEPWVTIGGPTQVVESWLINEADPITAIKRAIQVDSGCGYPITVAYLDGRTEVVAEDGSVTKVHGRRR